MGISHRQRTEHLGHDFYRDRTPNGLLQGVHAFSEYKIKAANNPSNARRGEVQLRTKSICAVLFFPKILLPQILSIENHARRYM